MNQQRKITTSVWQPFGPIDPEPPPGEGWRMEGMTVLPPHGLLLAPQLVYAWVRDAGHSQQCENPARPECRSMAFKAGRCVGCGWEQAQA